MAVQSQEKVTSLSQDFLRRSHSPYTIAIVHRAAFHYSVTPEISRSTPPLSKLHQVFPVRQYVHDWQVLLLHKRRVLGGLPHLTQRVKRRSGGSPTISSHAIMKVIRNLPVFTFLDLSLTLKLLILTQCWRPGVPQEVIDWHGHDICPHFCWFTALHRVLPSHMERCWSSF